MTSISMAEADALYCDRPSAVVDQLSSLLTPCSIIVLHLGFVVRESLQGACRRAEGFVSSFFNQGPDGLRGCCANGHRTDAATVAL